MEEAGIKKGDPRLKAIAVTMGPGQEMSINVGLRKAQELGKELNVPVIPVNHLEGHVMVSNTILYLYRQLASVR
jgi:N6-L-threonylcarbamoyladenine synthase